MKYRNIKKLPFASYKVDIWWGHLESYLQRLSEDYGLDMDPDFQRGYVWSEEQQIKYCGWIMIGGFSGKDIFMNSPDWMGLKAQPSPLVLIDGKQRINAVLSFLNNKIKVFDNYINEFEDKKLLLGSLDLGFRVHINNLSNREEILKWYLSMNEGGTVHTEDDLNRVRNLINEVSNE